MKFVSFNINGIRAHMHQFDAIIKQLDPDIIGLQETKVPNDLFPVELAKKYGYHVYYYGQKKYCGVALFLKQFPLSVTQGFKDDNASQTRMITATVSTSIGILTIINGYFPQGENNYSEKFTYKRKFYQNLQNYIQNTYDNQSLLLIMGDMNIAPSDLDIGFNERNKKKWIKSGKCAFLPEERQWMNHLINWGLVDIYRHMHPYNNKRYSWFSYQFNRFSTNQGLRIDLILITKPLIQFHIYSEINYNIRNMLRSSDHAPVWIDLNI